MASKYGADKTDLFDKEINIEAIDAELYGSVDIPASGRVVAKPIDIMQISADLQQPRRAVPALLRLYWDGSAGEVIEMLAKWYALACDKADVKLDVIRVIDGLGEGIDTDGKPALFQDYVELLRLAASIKREGLVNPISVIESADGYVIEAGERRWLAHHLLGLYAKGDDWNRIAAVKTKRKDSVWRQAHENGNRARLKPIAMARQLSILIMDLRVDIGGQEYADYQSMKRSDGCDRYFYAQVADGVKHRVPRGMGERIEAAMGLSESQLSRYRHLLKLTDDDEINDDLWMAADLEDWPEFSIRKIAAIPISRLKEMMAGDKWTFEQLTTESDTLPAGKVSGQKEPENGDESVGDGLDGAESGDSTVIEFGHKELSGLLDGEGDDPQPLLASQEGELSSDNADSVVRTELGNWGGKWVRDKRTGIEGTVKGVQGGVFRIDPESGDTHFVKRGDMEEVFERQPVRDAVPEKVESVEELRLIDAGSEMDGILSNLANIGKFRGDEKGFDALEKMRRITREDVNEMNSANTLREWLNEYSSAVNSVLEGLKVYMDEVESDFRAYTAVKNDD